MNGAVEIIHSDCLDVLPTLEGESIDCIVADPPYMLGAASARKSADKAIGWADINNASYWYRDWMAEAWRCLKSDGGMWVFGNWRSFPVYQCAASKIAGMSILSVVVWDKEWPSVGSMRGLRQNYELIALFGKPGFSIKNRSTSDIWREKWSSSKPSGHPQEKPASIVRRMFDVSDLKPGSTVCDPFMGSGTTGEAAVLRGHRFIGIELDDQHFASAQSRIARCRLRDNATPLLEAMEA